jgi:phospholipase C
MKGFRFGWPAMYACAAAAILTGCGGSQTFPGSQAASFQARSQRALPLGALSKIQHVIWILQDGRTVDNLFQGYPGGATVSRGKLSDGKTVALKPVSLTADYAIEEDLNAMFVSCDGTGTLPGTDCKMDGFDKEYVGCGKAKSETPCPNKHPQYIFVPHDETKPYFAMAHEWVLADNVFQSQLDGIFTASQYTIAAQAGSSVNSPSGAWACAGGQDDMIATLNELRRIEGYELACFDYKTLGNELDDAKLSWRYYISSDSGLPSPYAAAKRIVDGPYYSEDVVGPPKQFLKDVAAGNLADVTWITPNALSDSDAPGAGGGYGPSWVAALVNVVGESKFWDTTAIFVQWETWGGVYDHAPPPYVNYDGLGLRIPLLVISPYAKQNYVSHVQYETASVLRFAEDVFGLNQLAAADKRATSPAADCFDFSQKPREFVPIKAPKGTKFFLHQGSTSETAPRRAVGPKR